MTGIKKGPLCGPFLDCSLKGLHRERSRHRRRECRRWCGLCLLGRFPLLATAFLLAYFLSLLFPAFFRLFFCFFFAFLFGYFLSLFLAAFFLFGWLFLCSFPLSGFALSRSLLCDCLLGRFLSLFNGHYIFLRRVLLTSRVSIIKIKKNSSKFE
jgi:hypothetical protein